MYKMDFKVIFKVKRKICKFLEPYRYIVNYEYGWINTKKSVEKFRQKTIGKYDKCAKVYDANKQDKFIFIGDKNLDSTMRRVVFGDIDQQNIIGSNCKFYTTRVISGGEWLKKLHTLFWKINKKIPLPGKFVWERFYTTEDISKEKNSNFFFIFLGGAYFEETFAQRSIWNSVAQLSQEYYVKRILYLVDPVDKFPSIKYWFPFFDYVAGCAPKDKEKYGLEYIDTPCVKFDRGVAPIKYDLYIRAINNGRRELIERIYEKLSKQGVKCDFHIQELGDIVLYQGIDITKSRIPYSEMLSEELNANVLLEVIVPNVDAGTTLRYKEAVMYGKKLLTNNPSVFSLPCYNPKYIHYFENLDDIDDEWIKRRENVEYLYHGEFSTDAFCKKIIKLVTE